MTEATCRYCNRAVYNPCKNSVAAFSCDFLDTTFASDKDVTEVTPLMKATEEELLAQRRTLEQFNIDAYGLQGLLGILLPISHQFFLKHLSEAKEEAIAAIKQEQARRVTKGT